MRTGVIALTRCASRRVGYACCGWLLVWGFFTDFAALLTSVPNCVLGGMMSMLFAQVFVFFFFREITATSPPLHMFPPLHMTCILLLLGECC